MGVIIYIHLLALQLHELRIARQIVIYIPKVCIITRSTGKVDTGLSFTLLSFSHLHDN